MFGSESWWFVRGVPPERDEMSTTVLEKQCACDGSASGPRIVYTSRFDESARALKFVFRHVRMACDVCNKPWKVGAGVPPERDP